MVLQAGLNCVVSEIVIVPSIYEPFGLVALEAMASGCLCVVADTGGLREVVPAVTCTAQASMLTGQTPDGHGIVGNGWLFKDTMEIRFWQQSNRLLQAAPGGCAPRRR